MPSPYEAFWTHDRYAVVGHSSRKKFPTLTYRGLVAQGKTVHAVDPSVQSIEGRPAHPTLQALPEPVEAVVLEVPKDETLDWVEQAIEAGIGNVWIHQFSETPEAIALAHEHQLNLLTRNCAVMYLTTGPSLHGLHRGIAKRVGMY